MDSIVHNWCLTFAISTKRDKCLRPSVCFTFCSIHYCIVQYSILHYCTIQYYIVNYSPLHYCTVQWWQWRQFLTDLTTDSLTGQSPVGKYHLCNLSADRTFKNWNIWDKVPKRGGGVVWPKRKFLFRFFFFFMNHKLSFPILQNMCNSENLA